MEGKPLDFWENKEHRKYPRTEKYMAIYSSLMIAMNKMDWTNDEWKVVSQAIYDFMDMMLFPRLGELCEGMKVDYSKLEEYNKELDNPIFFEGKLNEQTR